MKSALSFFILLFFASSAIASSTGVIDPNNTGNYKAAFLDSSMVNDTSINFGKFTTESNYNITVSDTGLNGYAWSASAGWMAMNCANTTNGCSSADGDFKVANDGNGNLSGYAWGEKTGWINFGPFTDRTISMVKINPSTGSFEGTKGNKGYAWTQNDGWIVFDCTNASICVNTDWRPASANNSSTGGNVTIPISPATQNSNPPESAITGPSQPPTATTTEPPNNPAQSTNEPGAFSNGITLPPSVSETVNGIFSKVGNVLYVVRQAMNSLTTIFHR